MKKMIFSRRWTTRELTVHIDEDFRALSIEADGKTLATVRVDDRGDAIAYTPATEEDEK